MYKTCLLIALFITFGSAAVAQEAAKRPITLEELDTRQVVGALGKPLGTAVEIEATVIAGSELGLKQYDGVYLLKVSHVDGKKLEDPAVLRFVTPGFSHVKLANDHFSLYELKHGEKARSLNSTQIDELEKGYVGKSVRLAVYEVGRFHGIPTKLPDDAPLWADAGFHFDTSIVILSNREKPQEKVRNEK